MTPALHIQGLRKTYKNGFQALKGIDLVVEQGDFFALLGPNGAGKSTTIGIMSSLVNKSAGKVRIFGLDIDTQFAHARRHIGLVPQEFNFNMFEPVEEIVANQAGFYGIPRREAREATAYYLHQLGLWSKRREMARELSGGMKRRLMIARALVHHPRLLVLDEPTAGVDIEMRRSMWSFFTAINAQGTTIILTTHYLEEAENLCRHIAIINEGRIVEQTNLRRLLDRLHVEQFVFYLSAPLKTLPELPGFELRQVDPTTLEVCFRRGASVNALFQALTRYGIQVSSMKNKVNRLEELFIDLVGNSKTP